MDIVTHAMTGAIIAAPFLPIAPLTASCFVLGSVLPDADALSRLCGKVAFLKFHQTYTHSIPVIVTVTAVLWAAGHICVVDEQWVAEAFGAGMLLHAVMDATNTYGVALLAPFGRRRYCAEWVFFIDAVVIAVNVVGLSVVLVQLNWGNGPCLAVSASYGGFLVGYWALRGLLHRRAASRTPFATQSLIPSAMIPWRYLGYSLNDDVASVFAVNAIHGACKALSTRPVYDSRCEVLLAQVAEYGLMRELSKGYCVVGFDQHNGKTELVCRDLRTRNFGGRFGGLDLTFDAKGRLERKVFHV